MSVCVDYLLSIHACMQDLHAYMFCLFYVVPFILDLWLGAFVYLS